MLNKKCVDKQYLIWFPREWGIAWEDKTRGREGMEPTIGLEPMTC